MLEARRSEQWDHTAALMSLLANINRNPKKRSKPFGIAEFHPFRDTAESPPEPERKPPQLPITFLRDIFVRPALGIRTVKLTPRQENHE